MNEQAAAHDITREFLFAPNGELIFYFDRDEKERRFYFSGEALVAYAAGDTLYEKDADSHIDKQTVAGILQRSRYLAGFFEKL